MGKQLDKHTSSSSIAPNSLYYILEDILEFFTFQPLDPKLKILCTIVI